MKTLLAVASAIEMLTGLALLVVPPVVMRLLFVGDVGGAGIAASRVAGIALIALGVACRPVCTRTPAAEGMLAYNALVAAYFVYLGLATEWVGKLLWPAAAFHGVMAALLVMAWFRTNKYEPTKGTIP